MNERLMRLAGKLKDISSEIIDETKDEAHLMLANMIWTAALLIEKDASAGGGG